MSQHESTACSEYVELSRRGFLGGIGASAAVLAAAPAWLPRVAIAKDYRAAQRDVVVSIFLRGAADGMTLCVPYGDPVYYSSRPTIAIPRPDSGLPNKAIDLDGFFGLPTGMASLLPAYQDGNLLILHATGSVDPSRSHFDAQRFMEVGKAQDLAVNTGWLGRHILSTGPMTPGAVLRAVGITSGLQLTLAGAPQTLPIPDLDKFGLDGSGSTASARQLALGDMYALVADPLKAAAQTTAATISLLNTIDFAGYIPNAGSVYPATSFGTALKSSAALIKAQVGVEAIAIDLGGWDTHTVQGTQTGYMATLMAQLADTLAAFHNDVIRGTGPSVTVVVMSEFGRRLVENGSQGTDHGHGNAMFVMGRCISGGRVLANWPGLTTDKLFEGKDLQVTIDYRDVLAEIATKRLGTTDLNFVFPSFTPTDRGVVSC